MTLKTVSLKCIIIFQYFSLLFLFLQEKYINNDAVFKKKRKIKIKFLPYLSILLADIDNCVATFIAIL